MKKYIAVVRLITIHILNENLDEFFTLLSKITVFIEEERSELFQLSKNYNYLKFFFTRFT